MTSELTSKQDAFVKEYIINGGNATQAAIKAGYKVKTAQKMGSENLSKPLIKDYLEKHRKSLEKSHIWNKEKKLEILQSIAANGIRDTADKDGNMKMENPSASVAAIKEHNLMQGDNAPLESNTNITVSQSLEERLTGGSKR